MPRASSSRSADAMGAVNRSKYSESVCDRYLAIPGGLPDDEGSEDYEAVESDSNRRARLDGGPRACMCYNCRRGWRCKWDSDEEWDSEEEWDGRDLPVDHADEERWDDGGEYHGLPAKMRPMSLTQSWLNKDPQQETPQEPESS